MKKLSKIHRQSGYSSMEILLFILCITAVIGFNLAPLQKAWSNLKESRTLAATSELDYRKQRYLFESTSREINTFNQASDADRWVTLSQSIQRGGKNVPDPFAFIRYSGKKKIFIGRDSEEVLISP